MKNEENKKWYFNRDGVLEEVPVERWIWGVVYNDGTELHQYDDNGFFHQIGQIKQDEVKLWVLYKPGRENKRIDIVLPAGARIIHKYKRYVFNWTGECEKRVTVYVFGYKNGDKYHYNYVLPDDRIVQSTEEIGLTEFDIEPK